MFEIAAKASSLLRSTFLGSNLSGKLAKSLVASAILLLATGVTSIPATAQTTSGDIVGTVFDSSGAGVPNATVQATNVDTNVSNSARTTDKGEYRIGNLLVGHYNL